jgi:predicted dehydrogenase
MITQPLGIAIVGCGGVTLQNHLPGIAMCRDARVVALCDMNPAVLEKAGRDTGISIVSTKYEQIVSRDDVAAVIIATPNISHKPIALAAIAHGKHVLC